jgi:hypothetical protein
MADFALFGEAVAQALGEELGKFLEVLKASRAGADHSALEGSPIAPTLYRWIRDRGRPYTGTPTALLEDLNAAADEETRRKRKWPPNPQALGRLLRRIGPALRRLGVLIEHGRVGHDRTKTVTITYTPARAGKTSSASSAGAQNAPSDTDLPADDASSATSSARRPHPERSSAPNVHGSNGVTGGADDADDVSRAFAGQGEWAIRNGVTEEGDIE